MKKFIINILVFFSILAVIDLAIGQLFWKLHSSVAGGRTYSEYYACKESNEDMIIMGSSRASHHYVPQIITDSLGLSCFNAGQDGNGIIMQYGRWKMISARYAPKVLIYDIYAWFDMAKNDNMAYIDHLKPFCKDKVVMDYVADIFPMERLKLMSQMYRYNYKFLEILSDCVRGSDGKLKGYIPLKGQMSEEIVRRFATENKDSKVIVFDNTKLKYLERLAEECGERGTKLVFVVSPFYGGGEYDKDSYGPLLEIAGRYDVPLYYLNNEEYNTRPEYFKDSYHLNDEGAKELTKKLVELLRIRVYNCEEPIHSSVSLR